MLDVVSPGVLTVPLSPSFQLGPLTLAWHGIMTAVGLVVGVALARRAARERGLDPELLTLAAIALTLAGIAGARAYYLLQADTAALVQPSKWFASTGFAFYGALLAGVPAAWVVLRRSGRRLFYLDALAAGFPLGMAVGRIGDLILGEHYGPRTDALWGVAYTSPAAEVPRTGVGYQSGALYEIILALVMLALIWPCRERFVRPGSLLATVIVLYAAGRFAIFFAIRDTDVVILGLRQAQLTSLALVAAGLLWLVFGRRRSPAGQHPA